MDREIKKLLLLIVLVFIPIVAFANTSILVQYTLTPVMEQRNSYLQVEMKFQGNNSGLTPVIFPSSWAGFNYIPQIKNVRVKNHSVEIIDSAKPELKFIKHNGNAEISLTYEIHRQKGNPSDVHAVIIRNDLIHFPGHGVFALPFAIVSEQGLPINQKFDIEINWQNLPSNWSTASSYGINNTIKVSGDSSSLLAALYVAGDIRLMEIPASNGKIYLSLSGNFNLGDSKISETLANIIISQRNFFNDHDFPYFYVSIIESENQHMSGGTGLYNAFAAYLPSKLSLKEYIILFSHEHFHNWLGSKIHNSLPDSRYYWWSEGFTEYYARVLAFRNGILSLEAFIEECNYMLQNYYLSPVISEANSRIESDFWNNYDIQKLPYYRGFIFALYLNDLIRQDMKGVYSLDDVMLGIFHNHQKTGKDFNQDMFVTAIKNFTNKDINEDLRKYIDRGEIIYLSGLAQHLPIIQTEVKKINLGFSTEIALSKAVVKNINRNSNAYQAGIREGDIIKDLKVMQSNDKKFASVIVNDKIVTFQLDPDKKFQIWQFKTKLTAREQELIREWFLASSR